MIKYKAGDKVVLDVLSIDDNGWYKIGGEYYSWWENPNYLDKVSEPLSEYTEKLEKKNEKKQERLNRQVDKITWLLEENSELKDKIHNITDAFENFKTGTCDACEHIDSVEKARAAGQEEAWKLALKLRYMDYEDKVECFGLEYDGKEKWIEIMEKYTYTEAAAKVEEYEKKNKKLNVGDVVKCIEKGEEYVVTCIADDFRSFSVAINKHGDYIVFKEKSAEIKKTGRTLPVSDWLKQIGGEE